MKQPLNEQFIRMQKLAGIIPNIIKENMDNWGNETDDYGRNERDYKPKPSLADFDYNKEEYKKYMEEHFPEEPLNENQSEKFDEIYKAFQQDPVLKNWIYPEGERKRLNINTFMIPGKVFEENFLDIISQKTGLQKDDVRKKLLDNPHVGTKRPTENSEYDFVDRSPTIYTNGNYLNAYEVLKNALKEL